MPHSRSCSFCTTSEQFIADALTATDYLRDRFGTDRVYLMAHSGGTFTALQTAARAPHRTAPDRWTSRTLRAGRSPDRRTGGEREPCRRVSCSRERKPPEASSTGAAAPVGVDGPEAGEGSATALGSASSTRWS
jgi:pimeloyl-ACP methyl ester carboxylesterase